MGGVWYVVAPPRRRCCCVCSSVPASLTPTRVRNLRRGLVRTGYLASKQVVQDGDSRRYATPAGDAHWLRTTATVMADTSGWALAVFGLAYWGLTFGLYWNFISYMLTIGPIATIPAIAWSYTHRYAVLQPWSAWYKRDGLTAAST